MSSGSTESMTQFSEMKYKNVIGLEGHSIISSKMTIVTIKMKVRCTGPRLTNFKGRRRQKKRSVTPIITLERGSWKDVDTLLIE